MKVNSRIILLFINVGIILGVILGYKDYHVDKLSLFAIAVLSFLSLNGMFLIIRRRAIEIPAERLKRLNRFIIWPYMLLAALIYVVEYLLKRR